MDFLGKPNLLREVGALPGPFLDPGFERLRIYLAHKELVRLLVFFQLFVVLWHLGCILVHVAVGHYNVVLHGLVHAIFHFLQPNLH